MLVQYNPQLQFVADFATSWSESSGGKVWTFHTQPGAKWSDGKPLTAADAAWTYQTILKYQDGATANSAGYVAHMKSATAPNATTLVLTYKRPVANVLSQVQQVPILPEHVWAKYATGNGKALTRFSNNAPIVSGGPFVLTKYTPKQIALFKRNPTFYGPKPHIDGFGLQFFQTTDADDHRAEEPSAGRGRGCAADLGGHAQVRPLRGAVQPGRGVRRLHHQRQPAAASQPQGADESAGAAGVRRRDRPAGHREDVAARPRPARIVDHPARHRPLV